MVWGSYVTKNPILLADAIELAVAFDDERYGGQFTRAEFQNLVATEDLTDDEQSFLGGDEADERNDQFEQALALMRNRAIWLGETYPFVVEDNEVHFVSRCPLERHLCYLFLLICSNSNSVPVLKSRLPDQFEDLCREAFRSLFPAWAEVLSFSQRSEDRKKHFGYSAKDAIPILAKKLNTNVLHINELPDTQREFGIDLIAICSFDDQVPYQYFAFAQCTIGQEWWEKRHEARADTALSEFIHLNVRHTNFLMIPHFPRFNHDSWSEEHSRTGNCILCDRLRICSLLEKSRFFEDAKLPESIASVFTTLKANLVVSALE